MARTPWPRRCSSRIACRIPCSVELEPDNVGARADLGRVYTEIDAWDDALREAETIAGKDPGNASAMYLRAAALNAKGQRQDALAAIDNALAAGQSAAEVHILHGDILSGLGRRGEAEQAYRAALAQSPKDAPARVGLGDLLRRQNRPDEARRLLEQAKADEPTNASVRLALSAVHATARRFDEALKELDSLPRQNWTPRVALAAGQLYVQGGQFREAVETLTSLKQIAPDLAPARYMLGHALLGLDRPDDALVEFRAAVQRAPGNVLAHFGLAGGLLQAGQPREALAELNRLAKVMQTEGEASLTTIRPSRRPSVDPLYTSSMGLPTGLHNYL